MEMRFLRSVKFAVKGKETDYVQFLHRFNFLIDEFHIFIAINHLIFHVRFLLLAEMKYCVYSIYPLQAELFLTKPSLKSAPARIYLTL
jgi:hypothetical protein